MKKELFFTSIILMTSFSSHSEEIPEIPDSLKQINLSEIMVSATRVKEGTPIAFTNLNTAQIKESNAAKNIPFILQTLPSVVAYSEDGSGVGNTSLRIRGTDATRINVTINGMPLNNPESQEVYWVNLPDISNSLQNVQVQRGIGSSTTGSAAFGASISLKTAGARQEAYGEASTAVGSYNTVSSTIAAGTGILSNGLSFDARYSRVTGDGYIRNGKVNHKNAYAAISYYKDNQLLRLSYINGIQHTGITWEGVSPEDMEKYGRRYNPAGKYKDDAGNEHFYDNETDNHYANIAQLSYSNELNDQLSLNVGLSYFNGYGYYENYKRDRDFLKEFGLQPQEVKDIVYTSSDVIRRKALENNFYVMNATMNYNKGNLGLTGGVSYSIFDGEHFGRLRWVKFNENIPFDYQWYYNDSKKNDFNIFARGSYLLNKNFSLFADMQYRYIDYRMKGEDDDLQNITNNNYYSFFNPKAGLSYRASGHEIYGSVAVGNREPLRTDIKESFKGESKQRIKPERMYDYEFGYKFADHSASFNANFYYMYYKDQMVQTGKLNDVGYKLMENVPTSYRAGVELIGAYKFNHWMRIDANLTLSQNKIKDYTVYYDIVGYDDKGEWAVLGQDSKDLGKTDISFSPNVVGSGILTFTPDNFIFSLVGKYVGKQYYDNTSTKTNQLDDYFVANFMAGYKFKTKQMGNIDVQFYVNNLLNKRYIANAWVSSERYIEDSELTVYRGFFPQATRNIMFKLGISF